MIPLKLTLRNFMCYRDNVPTINFEGIRIACISGNNGNGKSALIDAITWALWGETRASATDDLIHAGRSEVRVEFEFAVGKLRYRIIRQHSKPKTQKGSGQTILDFQLVTSDGFKALTGNTASETQKIITRVLHMDYNTFINSAFLRQGHADEFTRKPAGERKQVLGSILQLSVYDALEERSRELGKEQELLGIQLESALSLLRSELADRPAIQAVLEKLQSQLIEVENQVKEKDLKLDDLRKQKEILEHKKNLLIELTNHINESQRSYKIWHEQAASILARIKGYEEVVNHKAAILENYGRYLEARKQFQEMEQKFRQENSFSQARRRLEMAIFKAGEELNSAHAICERGIRDLESRTQKLPELQRELNQSDGELRNLEQSENALHDKQDYLKTLQAKLESIKSEKVGLTQAGEQIEEKIDLLEHKTEGTCKCPLCETELGEEGQKRILTKYLSEKSANAGALQLLNLESGVKESEMRSLETQISRLDMQQKRNREAALTKRGNLTAAVADAQESFSKIESEKKQLLEIENRLAKRDFALKENESLAQIEKEIADIGYDPQKHDLLRNQVTSYEKHEDEKRKLDQAEKLIIQDREDEDRARKMAQEIKNKIDVDGLRAQNLESELQGYSDVSVRLNLIENENRLLSGQQKALVQSCGGAKATLENLDLKETQKKEKESLLSATLRKKEVYKDLSQVFGKKGVQAMLIEMAIPEIESEANMLLARMTDNRMHIKMETQRPNRRGEQMETLDINISDELGTRNYEMFSGGEAFRIDFAIRIALAKLLAHRAGAPLPTLIIDEGFGTQDANGIEKIKEAITSIQDDFEKILVITHIADFKEAFPVRIEVVKTNDGSTLYMT